MPAQGEPFASTAQPIRKDDGASPVFRYVQCHASHFRAFLASACRKGSAQKWLACSLRPASAQVGRAFDVSNKSFTIRPLNNYALQAFHEWAVYAIYGLALSNT
eukprot:scaffold403505_cov17-Prasinocladus_malaysianus.AAC.1